MKTDEMTPLERIEAFKQGRDIDRIPCVSHLGEHAAVLVNVSVQEYLHSPLIMADAQARAFEIYGQDGVSLGPDLFGLIEALGVRLSYSATERPQAANSVIKNPDNWGSLEPANPEKDGRLPSYLEALEILRERIGDKVPIRTGISGPFTTAALLRGSETFMIDVNRAPEFVHKLMGFAVENILLYMRAAHKRGISCSMGDPMAAVDLIGPDLFRTFVKPYLKAISDTVHAETGSYPSLHICGDTLPILKDIAETGVKSFKLDERVDFLKAKTSVGKVMCLAGNVSPVHVLLNGSPSDVITASRECIRKAHDSPKGFVLSAGCSVPIATSPENIQAMMFAAKKYGSFPIGDAINLSE